MTTNRKSYKELSKLTTLEERYSYLKLGGAVGEDTFGYDRYMNQQFYRSSKWKNARNFVIERDNALDLGVPGYDIFDIVVVHHINPVTKEDIMENSPHLYDPNNLICVSPRTHKAIHFGDENLLPKPPIKRVAGDTIPWYGF